MAETATIPNQLQKAVERLEALAGKAEEGRAKRLALDAELKEAKAKLALLESENARLLAANRLLEDNNSTVAERLDKAIDQIKALVSA